MRGHIYTNEQKEYIRNNYSNIGKCVEMFNHQFGTNKSYSAIKSYALKTLGIRTGFRPWTKEMNESITDILHKYSYDKSTTIFNSIWNTSFTQKQIQDHCTRTGIKRGHADSLKKVDKIISENIDKPYKEIMQIVNEHTESSYCSCVSICRRANNIGLHREHRVWNNANDIRFINGEEVNFSEYVKFIGNRWHRLQPELQCVALQIVKLQTLTQEINNKTKDS